MTSGAHGFGLLILPLLKIWPPHAFYGAALVFWFVFGFPWLGAAAVRAAGVSRAGALCAGILVCGAIREVFGDNSPAISATKAMTGHSLGAAGVQEAIYSLLMLEHGFIAPSINVEELDEQAAGLNIVTKPTDAKLTTVMSNSFGFGGTNATLVMRKYNA